MTSLSRRLAWRELSTHKIRSGVAIALFALPIMVICAFTNALLGISAQSYDRGRLPSTYADISNTVCSEKDKEEENWCVRDREELEKPDIERIKNLVPDIADTFTPVWQLETSVASSYGADIRLTLKTSPQAKNEPQVPARGEIALSDDALSLLGKRVGEKMKFIPWAGAQPLTLTIAERTDDHSTNVVDGVAKAVGVLNKEDINVAQFGGDSELVSARLPQGISVEWESPRIVDQAVSQEEKGVSVHSVEHVIPSRYSSFLASYVDIEFLMFVSVGGARGYFGLEYRRHGFCGCRTAINSFNWIVGCSRCRSPAAEEDHAVAGGTRRLAGLLTRNGGWPIPWDASSVGHRRRVCLRLCLGHCTFVGGCSCHCRPLCSDASCDTQRLDGACSSAGGGGVDTHCEVEAALLCGASTWHSGVDRHCALES